MSGYQRDDGFHHYEYKPGDTRKALWEGAKFFGSVAWQSNTTKVAVALLLLGIAGEVAGANQKVRDKLATVLIGKSE